ncbi:MAG: tripartite tricarboxylate transporter substrate binding protein [Hydrogenophaga sp.]|uniref:Bug family tripartite tricarboxylate transporter substrate binding protein n=1 Tax=Hydrogenophaga sp. TaxID=1904254 RepID=UPI0016A7D39E|nr:tripartite tricarboxylate transporter substrate binding protein [Hydrogenophaga sp.]NIM43384.1 tripartite tricarboxylate transporter substrate binding protein [Hydrogenophaga sp.]NIN28453.1 tripartite tricarboxylate transporter substrate binding protein [Hydrogenophaga sp.]NIN32912.1 tripartite tricarboxylate transporter substrate binding protein [Hydrogenophaga sp.]NIN57587.1 tripartite tricarboxylate transporter substrate binding protein [Hydrogenophaga sp.]NIO53882.1 tripartite tricarbox
MTARRAFLGLALAAAFASPALHAQANWPTQTVRFVNNFPAGGPSDILARSVSQVLQEQFKQSFVVDNKPGAAGNIGAADAAKAAPDGNTLLFGIDTTFTINPHLYPNQGFKPTDLKPVIIMASSGLLIGVHPSTSLKTLPQLVEQSKSKNFNFSSAGSGSPGHLAVEVFAEATKHKLGHIPYRGNTPAVTAVLAGEVDGGTLATPGMLPHVKAGKITALAVTSRQRSTLAPEIPTVGELGLTSLEQEVLYLVMAPAATPDALVQQIAKAIADALQRPDVKARMASLDLFSEGLTGAAASKRLADMNARYGALVKATGMKVE